MLPAEKNLHKYPDVSVELLNGNEGEYGTARLGKWEWDLSFRWEWDGNGNEVTEMGEI